MPHIISVIPARGGSKRLPGKNLCLLGGVPLLTHSIRQSLACPLIQRHIVSTDDAEIAACAKESGAEVLQRPAALASDEAGTLPVLRHVLETVEEAGPPVDYVLLLQPTSPLRQAGDIGRALAHFMADGADALVAVSKAKLGPKWLLHTENGALQFSLGNDFQQIRGQDQPVHYLPNGYLYIYRRSALLAAEGYGWGKRTLPWVVPSPFDIDIDTENDLQIAEALLRHFPFDR